MRIPSSNAPLGPCRARRGLLFVRDCKAEATGACVKCGRPLCDEHRVDTPAGVLCAECRPEGLEASDGTTYDPSVYRHHFASRYGYHPYYYGTHHYYSDTDYTLFEDRTGLEHRPTGGVSHASEPGEDAGESDHEDYLES